MTQLKTRKQMSPIGKYMYATKKVSNRWKKMFQVKMRENVIEMLEPNVKESFE